MMALLMLLLSDLDCAYDIVKTLRNDELSELIDVAATYIQRATHFGSRMKCASLLDYMRVVRLHNTRSDWRLDGCPVSTGAYICAGNFYRSASEA